MRDEDVQQPNTGRNLVDRNQFAGLFGKTAASRRPGRRRRLRASCQADALLVLLLDEHQHGVFERGFGDRHRARQRVQNANLDRVFGGRGGKGGGGERTGKECAQNMRFEIHLVNPSRSWRPLWEDVAIGRGGTIRQGFGEANTSIDVEHGGKGGRGEDPALSRVRARQGDLRAPGRHGA